MVVGLTPGQPVVLGGARADAAGTAASEILVVADISHVGGFTSLKFVGGLTYSYLRAGVTISANVALATHGATVHEILGNGDASQPNQSFPLKRPPLTYVSAPTPTGIVSSLDIRVNDLEWTEAPTSFGLDAGDEDYVVRLADDGTPTVTFGDPATRLWTGQQNVRAVYRTGIGVTGNVGAGAISMLQSRPPGLRGVTNPLAASGGADPQNLDQARDNAPLTVLTLDRIVSLDDYGSFAGSFAGIGKAQAIAVWSGEARVVHITVAAANGDAVDPASPLYRTLVQAIELAHDPVQAVIVASYQPLTFNLTAAILIDQPRYEAGAVHDGVVAALTGAMSFARRSFAQAVTTAEIVTLIQAVPGVLAANITQLYLSNDPNGPQQVEPPSFLPASPARWENGAIQPAQLLLLNPLGATVTDMTQ
jgi:predicted phage baseplate assembly protein